MKINPNITPEGYFRLAYRPYAMGVEPHTPLEEAIQFLYDCWEYDEIYKPRSRKVKAQLLDTINTVLLPACDEGNQDSIFWMFFAYIHGLGVGYDINKALSYIEILAEYGYPDMQHELGELYMTYDDLKEVKRKAVKWLTKAAKQGFIDAIILLGQYYEGSSSARNRSARKSFLWYKRAAKKGDGRAMWMMKFYYQEGFFVKKDPVLAAKWEEKVEKANEYNVVHLKDFIYDNEDEVIDFLPYSEHKFKKDELFFNNRLTDF